MRIPLAWTMGFCVLVASSVVHGVPTTGPAQIGLATLAPEKIVRGVTVPIGASVSNLAAAGSNDLNYSIYYVLPDNSQTLPANGTKAADGGATSNDYEYDFDSTGAAYGSNNFKVRVADPNALNSPQERSLSVQVVNHVRPAMWFNGVEVPIQESIVEAPPPDDLAFGATGGGEMFSAAAPNVIGDPAVPTAAMDLDHVFSSGASQITTNLLPTPNVVASDDPSSGIAWQIFVDGSVNGHYSKILTLLFSDEDIPGAVSPDSIAARLEIDVDVTDDGVTGTLRVLPEPAEAFIVAPFLLLMRRRRAPVRKMGRP
jgi:hypothetical protein